MGTYSTGGTLSIRGQDADLIIEVDYDFIRASKGARDSLGGVRGAGPPLEPDEPAHCELTEARAWTDPKAGPDDPGVNIWTLLTKDQREALEEACLENHDE